MESTYYCHLHLRINPSIINCATEISENEIHQQLLCLDLEQMEKMMLRDRLPWYRG